MIGLNVVHVQPAYGRSYASEEEVLRDWDANKDFTINGGPYVNKSDWITYGNPMNNLVYFYKNLYVRLA